MFPANVWRSRTENPIYLTTALCSKQRGDRPYLRAPRTPQATAGRYVYVLGRAITRHHVTWFPGEFPWHRPCSKPAVALWCRATTRACGSCRSLPLYSRYVRPKNNLAKYKDAIQASSGVLRICTVADFLHQYHHFKVRRYNAPILRYKAQLQRYNALVCGFKTL